MTAIAAAAIGAILALLFRGLWEVPGNVRQHDRRVAELDEDLETWVVDDDSELRADLLRIDNEHSARGTLNSGLRVADRNAARGRALLRYRNEERRVRREANELRNAEGVLHRAWRWICHNPLPDIRAPERVEPVLDRWRSPDGSQHPGGFPDPTRLGLEDLLSTSPTRNPWWTGEHPGADTR